MPPGPENGNASDPRLVDRHEDAATLALRALGWVMADDARARRLLDITGLDPAGLREGLGQGRLLGAVLAFLEGHEPDLLACAQALGLRPGELVEARRMLGA